MRSRSVTAGDRQKNTCHPFSASVYFCDPKNHAYGHSHDYWAVDSHVVVAELAVDYVVERRVVRALGFALVVDFDVPAAAQVVAAVVVPDESRVRYDDVQVLVVAVVMAADLHAAGCC